MTIRTEVNPKWQAVLDVLTMDEQEMLVAEAEHLADALTYRNRTARISTNGALEVLFAIGCAYNKIGQTPAQTGKGN